MVPIIAIYDTKDMIIVILSMIIVIKILLIFAYYHGVNDTRRTINGFLKGDLSDFKKLKG